MNLTPLAADPETVAGLYDDMPVWSAPFGQVLLDAFPYRVGMTVLDVGSGTGFPALELAMRLGVTSTVFALDPWSAGLARLKAKAHWYNHSTLQILEGRAEQIPLGAACIDCVTSNNGFNNTDSMLQAFTESFRVLKPGGSLLMTMNLDGSFSQFYSVLESVLAGNDLESALVSMQDHIRKKRPPVRQVTDWLQAAGFTAIQIREHEFSYWFANGSALLNHGFIRLAFLPSWLELVDPLRRDAIFRELESRLNSQSEDPTGLRMAIPFVLIRAQKPLAGRS